MSGFIGAKKIVILSIRLNMALTNSEIPAYNQIELNTASSLGEITVCPHATTQKGRETPMG